jgi:hypothetical protein
MPTFKYNPTSPDDPDIIRTHNRTFAKGETFELADDDPLARKLRGHPQFAEEGAEEQRGPQVDQRQAEINAQARDQIDRGRKETGEARQKAQEALAQAEADERRLAANERALGTLSPAEVRAMDQVRGVRGEDGPPVPGEPGYAGDNVSGGGQVPRQQGIGDAGGLNPDNQAKAEGRAQQ